MVQRSSLLLQVGEELESSTLLHV